MIFVYLAEGFEEIEALTAVDLLRRAGLDVKTVGVGGGDMVSGAHGIAVRCDLDERAAAELRPEMVVLPGGMPGTVNLERSGVVRRAIEAALQEDRYVAAICAAPSILGHLGVLKGKRYTCFPGFESEIEGGVHTGALVESDGRLITGKGPGAAIPFALRLVSLLAGTEIAEKIEESLQCR